MKQENWFFFHYLPYDPTLIFWFFNGKVIRRSTWIIWGGDLYAFQRSLESFRTKLYEKLRRKIIPKFPEIACFIEEDYQLARNFYGSRADYSQILYPLPVNIDHIDTSIFTKEDASLRILLGNSADPSNRHVDALQKLARYNSEDITVFCPLSYGGGADYIETVIRFGKEKFGDKFIPLLNKMDQQAYGTFLGQIDIVIMNHNRQQGLGNILVLLLLGKKIFLNPETTTYSFLTRNQCKVYNINSIDSAEFHLFKSNYEGVQMNVSFARLVMDSQFSINLWNSLINKHEK